MARGRKPVADAVRRRHRVQVYLTASEQKALRTIAARLDMSASSLVRHACGSYFMAFAHLLQGNSWRREGRHEAHEHGCGRA